MVRRSARSAILPATVCAVLAAGMLPAPEFPLASGAAWAQAQQEACRAPREPRIPRGASVTRREMEDAERQVADYHARIRSYLQCLERAMRDATESDESVDRELQRQIGIFNSRG